MLVIPWGRVECSKINSKLLLKKMPTGPSKGLSINEMDTNRNRYLIPSNKHSSCESMTELNGKRISANSHIKRKLLNETSLYTTFR